MARLSPAGTAVRASLGLGSRADDVDRLTAALAALASHGPAWTYAGAEQGYVPLPDPRALPGWLTGAAGGAVSPCTQQIRPRNSAGMIGSRSAQARARPACEDRLVAETMGA
jgi:hypothetical protein